eukprot:9115-Heterococcus_DN1.PRE.2
MTVVLGSATIERCIAAGQQYQWSCARRMCALRTLKEQRVLHIMQPGERKLLHKHCMYCRSYTVDTTTCAVQAHFNGRNVSYVQYYCLYTAQATATLTATDCTSSPA